MEQQVVAPQQAVENLYSGTGPMAGLVDFTLRDYCGPNPNRATDQQIINGGYSTQSLDTLVQIVRVVTNTEAAWRGLNNQEIAAQYPPEKFDKSVAIARLAEEVTLKEAAVATQKAAGGDPRVLEKQLNYLRDLATALPQAI